MRYLALPGEIKMQYYHRGYAYMFMKLSLAGVDSSILDTPSFPFFIHCSSILDINFYLWTSESMPGYIFNKLSFAETSQSLKTSSWCHMTNCESKRGDNILAPEQDSSFFLNILKS